MLISSLKGFEIFDSRGMPTLEVRCILDSGEETTASVPSGAITGKYESVSKDIKTAINNIQNVLEPTLIGKDSRIQDQIDSLLISTDSSPDKSNLGGNTLLGISIAVARAGALVQKIPLSVHLANLAGFEINNFSISNLLPMFNIINGGIHADNNLSFQEFMVVPLNTDTSFYEKMKQGKKIFDVLGKRLDKMKKTTNVGDEGGYAPELNSNEEAIEILVEAIQESGFTPQKDVGIAIDIAASGIPDLMIATYPKQPLDYYKFITAEYPIISLEDPYVEEDEQKWIDLTVALGGSVSIVGDDLFTTNPTRLKNGISKKIANSISIKPNQIGTVMETIQTVKIAKENNIDYQISHRAGETEDTFISDLAIATGAKYLKAGAPNRGERIAKYNQIIRIEKELGRNG